MTAITGRRQAPVTSNGGRRCSRRQVQIAGWTMIWLGVLLIGFLGYQLWGPGSTRPRRRNRLDFQLSERLAAPAPPTLATPPPVSEADPLSSAPTAVLAPTVVPEAARAEGEALGRIRIPTADVDHVMVSGVTREVLKLGPGHMPWTPLPGQPGNAVVSGHRTTYGAPFFHLDQVELGDEIYVETLIGTHTYRVGEILVGEPTDVWVTDPRPGAWLTLTTCTPRYS
ncbi:MAG: sortase, partial [Acidimicrobiia bacterium]